MREKNQARNMAAEQATLQIGTMAWKALLEEVYTTPKPGLVDLYSRGAHKDMDVRLFEKSASALLPFFARMAYQGYVLSCSYEALFLQVRKTGVAAEQVMYRVTGGVNTHKGAIFTIGVYCAAAGRCLREANRVEGEELRRIQVAMTAHVLERELDELRKGHGVSHGERNLGRYGTKGIRGEAIGGYRSVWELAMPIFVEGVCQGRPYNNVKLQTLFTLMSKVEDSNVLARHDMRMLAMVRQEAVDFLARGGAYGDGAIRELEWMDAAYIRRNISAGGCADLLAATIFLWELESSQTGAWKKGGSGCCWKGSPCGGGNWNA